MNQDELKQAIAAQEEYIKREQSCRGEVGRAHAFRPFGKPTHRSHMWSQCIACDVTETGGDYEIKRKASQ